MVDLDRLISFSRKKLLLVLKDIFFTFGFMKLCDSCLSLYQLTVQMISQHELVTGFFQSHMEIH